eukprot:TRINITY_DN11603_c0_g1_i2.p1 TRINITY_DN11603_c0_g1~~TRINITY_DN11603_c0_g1_i2.p1  ORF type:complete len:281 (-),score=42.08 TRINITY_DN11603_c0_g1_i2:457-1299(-)
MCSYDCLYISSAAILYMYNYQSAILLCIFFFLMIRRPPRSTLSSSSAASDVYKRQRLFAQSRSASRTTRTAATWSRPSHWVPSPEQLTPSERFRPRPHLQPCQRFAPKRQRTAAATEQVLFTRWEQRSNATSKPAETILEFPAKSRDAIAASQLEGSIEMGPGYAVRNTQCEHDSSGKFVRGGLARRLEKLLSRWDDRPEQQQSSIVLRVLARHWQGRVQILLCESEDHEEVELVLSNQPAGFVLAESTESVRVWQPWFNPKRAGGYRKLIVNPAKVSSI